MKKLICILLAILTLASILCSCGRKTKDPSSSEASEAAQTAEATEEQEGSPAYDTPYGGLTGKDAILTALGFVGAGYQCVYYDRRFLRNNEAWYIGLKASDGSDKNVYYVYVNEDSCVPVDEIPNIGGENREDSGVFKADYAGISEQEAIFTVLGKLGGYQCISSEQSESDGTEYWLIGVENAEGSVIYFYVNADSCFQKE